MMPLPIAPILAPAAVLPPWVVLPIAAAAMLVIAAHILAMYEVEMPPRRRRIRTASGFLMMVLTCLLAYALSLAPVGGGAPVRQDHAGLFVEVWLVIVVLIGMIVMLAGLDAVETIRLSTASRRQMRRRLRENMERIVAERRIRDGT